LDKVSKIHALSLAVVDFVTNICVLGLEKVHDGEDLPVVRYKSFTNGFTASYEGL
jgi:hypothetical protein